MGFWGFAAVWAVCVTAIYLVGLYKPSSDKSELRSAVGKNPLTFLGLSLAPAIGAFILFVISGLMFTIAVVCGLYVLSPIDVIPDFIPVIGEVDDIVFAIPAVVAGSIGYLVIHLSQKVMMLEGEDDKNRSDRLLK